MSSRLPSVDSMAKAFGGPVTEWTPALLGASTPGSTQTYDTANNKAISIRIGNLVYIYGQLAMDSIGDVAGAIYITGVPYKCTNAPVAPVSIDYASNLNITAGESVAGYIGNSNQIQLRTWDAIGGQTNMQSTELATGADLVFSAWYITNDDF